MADISRWMEFLKTVGSLVQGVLQLALRDGVLNGLDDPLPRIGEQQVIDTPVRQRERRHLDNIHQLARLDDGYIVRLGVEGAPVLWGRVFHMRIGIQPIGSLCLARWFAQLVFHSPKNYGFRQPDTQ